MDCQAEADQNQPSPLLTSQENDCEQQQSETLLNPQIRQQIGEPMMPR
jgi:hypothetical protein